MAKIDIKANVTGPDEIEVCLVREDYLNVSNTFRIFFEVFFAVACTIFGNMLSFDQANKIPFIYWFILSFLIIVSVVTLILAVKNYNKAKSQKQ